MNYIFTGFTTFEQGWWYNCDLKRWENDMDGERYDYSSHQPCRTMKAFRRKLKKAPSGVEFVLNSRWVGKNITGVGTKYLQLTDRL